MYLFLCEVHGLSAFSQAGLKSVKVSAKSWFKKYSDTLSQEERKAYKNFCEAACAKYLEREGGEFATVHVDAEAVEPGE